MSDTNLPGGETPEQPGTPASPSQGAPLQPGSSAQPPQSVQPPTIQPPAAQQQPQGQQFPQAPAPGTAPTPPQAPLPAAAAPNAPGAPGAPTPPVPPQGAPVYAQQPAQQAPMNVLSIVSFVGSFFVSLVGIICGHIALGQIKKTGERGRGFALAGTIIGYVALAGTILSIILAVAAIGAASTLAQSTLDEYEQATEEIAPSSPSTDPLDGTATEGSDSGSADGTLSAEFCKALDDYMMLSTTTDPMPTEEEYAAALDKIASIPSPNQDEYRKGAELMHDPAKTATEEGAQMLDDFSTAAGEDWVACM